MYSSGTGSPHSHSTPMDVVPTTTGIPSTLNPLPRYYRDFQSHSRSNTAGMGIYMNVYMKVSKLGTMPYT